MIIPVGHGQATWIFSGPNLPLGAAVTLGFHDESGDPLSEVAFDLYTLFADTLLPNLHSQTIAATCRVKKGPNETGPVNEFSSTANGGVSGTGAPPNTAFLIEKRTALGGRKNRGRLYLPGIAEADVGEDGQINSTRLEALNVDCGSFFTGLVALNLPPEVLHTSSSDPTPITVFEADPVAGTQRRRMRR